MQETKKNKINSVYKNILLPKLLHFKKYNEYSRNRIKKRNHELDYFGMYFSHYNYYIDRPSFSNQFIFRKTISLKKWENNSFKLQKIKSNETLKKNMNKITNYSKFRKIKDNNKDNIKVNNSCVFHIHGLSLDLNKINVNKNNKERIINKDYDNLIDTNHIINLEKIKEKLKKYKLNSILNQSVYNFNRFSINKLKMKK